jgi:hypothetical protein
MIQAQHLTKTENGPSDVARRAVLPGSGGGI